MNHPSIRFRLMLGTGLILAVMLTLASVAIHRAFERTLAHEIEGQLIQSAALLAKSSELELTGLVYEWQEAMDSPASPDLTGIFTFWDLKSGRTTKSPDLREGELPFFHGDLNQPVTRKITLHDGTPAIAVGLLHLPFTDLVAEAQAAKDGTILRPENHPQVVVYAREILSLEKELAHRRAQLIRAAIATLLVTWGAIFAISTWCLRPIRDFSKSLLDRHHSENAGPAAIPTNLPSELLGLASAFNTTLGELEISRTREKEFVLHAAHELRTPVAGILATLEQAVHRPRESHDLASRIREAIHITAGMRTTLDSLMRLARLRGGLQISAKSTFDPIPILNEILTSAAPIADFHQLQIYTNFPPTDSLTADPGLFRVLTSNLIENAINHSPDGSTITFELETTPHRFVLVTTNPRANLTHADLTRIFEPFQRASTDEQAIEGHAGLGLSLAREAVHLLGGNLHAEINGDNIIFTATLLR